MKTRTHIIVMCGLLTLLSGTALSANDGDLKFVAPFSFAAGSKALPAGTYRVSVATLGQGVLAIRGASSAFVLSPNPESANNTESPYLVFNRYHDRYFLRVVRYADRTYALSETMQEREAATSRHGMTASAPETVAVQAAAGE
jgi:hypothetical protein